MRSRFRPAPRTLYATMAIIAVASAAWGVAPEVSSDVLQELSAAQKTALEAAFGRADANSDGRLSLLEAKHLPAIEARFAELDTDRDGSLSMAEFAIGYTSVN